MANQTKEKIIQHPNFSFNPTPGGGYARYIETEFLYEEPKDHHYSRLSQNLQIMPNRLFHEKFRITDNVESFLQGFMEGCLNFFTLNALSDEILWHDTGYWSIRNNETQFMGIGQRLLKEAIAKTKGQEILLCLSNRDSAIIFEGTVNARGSSRHTKIDAYSTNAFLPYTEVADIYRNGLKNIESFESVSNEFVTESDIHSRYSQEIRFLPCVQALVMMGDTPVLAAIENPLSKNVMALTDSILVETGGFDFDCHKSDYRLMIDQWRFENVTIFQFSIVKNSKMDLSWLSKLPIDLPSDQQKGVSNLLQQMFENHPS